MIVPMLNPGLTLAHSRVNMRRGPSVGPPNDQDFCSRYIRMRIILSPKSRLLHFRVEFSQYILEHNSRNISLLTSSFVKVRHTVDIEGSPSLMCA